MKELRPCLFKDKKALFHRWEEVSQAVEAGIAIGSHSAGWLKYTLAIIEFENGEIAEVSPTLIKFLDSEENFSEYCFKEYEEVEEVE